MYTYHIYHVLYVYAPNCSSRCRVVLGSASQLDCPHPQCVAPVLHSQCISMCCNALQCVAICHRVLQCVAPVLHSRCVAECCRVLQCVAVCCSVWQIVAVRCSELQCVANFQALQDKTVGIQTAFHLCCSVLQRVAACCSVLQCVEVCCTLSAVMALRKSVKLTNTKL